MMDDIVGEMTAFLEEHGLLENTVVGYSTDHGDMMGSHGLWEKGWPMLYEETNRIPLVVRIPGGFSGGVRNGELLSSADTIPVLANLAGCSFGTPGRNHCLSEAFLLDGGYNATGRPGGIPKYAKDLHGDDRCAIAVKTEQYKYIFHTHDRDELYDLCHDPGENVNLAPKDAYFGVRKELRNLLLDAVADNPPFHRYIQEAMGTP
jgi:arylsulfatase A-like enzyme